MIELAPYRTTDLEFMPTKPDALLTGQIDDELYRRFDAVIQTEGPITRELLIKRVINSLDIYKASWRLNKHFQLILDRFADRMSEEEGLEVYHAREERDNVLRTDSRDIRFSYQIPPCEAANALVLVIQESSKRLRKWQLYPLFVRTLGYSKCGSELKILFDKTVRYALEHEKVHRSNSSTYYI